MQYVGRAIGSVSKTWSSLNPATLSGAIDVIVVENEDGSLYCSPFHVRFGKFQLLRPSQKKVDFIVNGETTDIPMKLGEGGEAFFVFETDADVPKDMQTSPVASASPSPEASPRMSPKSPNLESQGEPEYLDINGGTQVLSDLKSNSEGNDSPDINDQMDHLKLGDGSETGPKYELERTNTLKSLERAESISKRFKKKNIPSTVEANGDILLDMHGYKSDAKDLHDSDKVIKQLLADEFGSDVDYNMLINKDLNGNIRITGNGTSPAESGDATSLSSNPSSHGSDDTGKNEQDDSSDQTTAGSISSGSAKTSSGDELQSKKSTVYFKTLRLTSAQLKCMSLEYGRNKVEYSVNKGKSVIGAYLYLWKWNVPIVISDIDGTITKSDTLGHLFTMFGKDWTHEGVARLFSDIKNNGYNVLYLTARSVGLADMTRSYLNGVYQNGYSLPFGPVILSPDRTMEALKREIVLKKPQVFKMACLKDIEALYFPNESGREDHMENASELNIFDGSSGDEIARELPATTDSSSFTDINTNTNTGSSRMLDEEKANQTLTKGDNGVSFDSNNNANSIDSQRFDSIPESHLTGSDILKSMNAKEKVGESNCDESGLPGEELKTPFYAGFGNRITDALSYRSVGIPSSRIFTINTDSEVHMELLEMAGYKASYVSIGELVDQFFPPVSISKSSKGVGSELNDAANRFSDVTFWRNPIPDLTDISEDESTTNEGNGGEDNETSSSHEEARNVGSLSPRLKSFFMRSNENVDEKEDEKDDSILESENGAHDDEDEEIGDDLDEDPDYVYEDDPDMEYEDEDSVGSDFDGDELEDYDDNIGGESVAEDKDYEREEEGLKVRNDKKEEKEEEASLIKETGMQKNTSNHALEDQGTPTFTTKHGSSSATTVMNPTTVHGSFIRN